MHEGPRQLSKIGEYIWPVKMLGNYVGTIDGARMFLTFIEPTSASLVANGRRGRVPGREETSLG